MICVTCLQIVGVAVVFFKNIDCVTVDEGFGNVMATVGESVTLPCDLRDTNGVDNIWFKNPSYFVSLGEVIEENVPSDITRRLSITCSELKESCYLTIANLRERDSGNYGCGIETAIDTKISYVSGYLTVQVPPTDTSPDCKLYDENTNRINSNMALVGDTVQFSCTITGGNPKPTVHLARGGIAVTATVQGSFTESYTLSEDDVGFDFTCVMDHPTLAQPRTCTLLTLLVTTRYSSTTTITSTPTDSRDWGSTRSKNTHTLTVPTKNSASTLIVIITVIVLFVLIAEVIGFLMCRVWRKRRQKHQSTTKPNCQDYGLTMDRDSSKTANYDVVNNTHSLDRSFELKTFSKSQTEKLLIQDQPSSSTADQKDVFPIYAKPDKTNNATDTVDKRKQPGQYDNFSHTSDGIDQDNVRQNGLNYADLDLPVNSDSNPPRKPKDVTVYADIQPTM